MFKKKNIENHVYDNLQTSISDEFNSKVYKYELTFDIYSFYPDWVLKKIHWYRAKFLTYNPSQKKSKVHFLKKVHYILQYCLWELFNFTGNRSEDFIEIKDFATIPPLPVFSDEVSQRRCACGIIYVFGAKITPKYKISYIIFIKAANTAITFTRLCHKDSYTTSQLANLRLCKTAITWLLSFSAILPLFWRHAIAELHRLCREDLRNVLWRHEIFNVFLRNMTYAQQNMQFSQYFTTKFNIFSLNLTGESDFFILCFSTHNKLSMSGF